MTQLLPVRPSSSSFTLFRGLISLGGNNYNKSCAFSVSAAPRNSSSGAPKTKGDGSLPTKTEPSKQRPPFESASLYRLTASPNPGWKVGEGLAASAGAEEWMQGEKEGWLSVNTSQTRPRSDWLLQYCSDFIFLFLLEIYTH